MLPTRKLYELDPMMQRFTATVLECTPKDGDFDAVLDATAFFPEGGGQCCDVGTLNGNAVTDVQIRDGIIHHTVENPLKAGGMAEGVLNWPHRRDQMEQHTGEHILSGVLHRLYGANNVGFHIGSPAVRMDMDKPLTPAQLAAAEDAANRAVRANTPVRCWIPTPEELHATEYRSKKELTGDVRLVEAGGDLCACCGTHLAATGEVGLIKILSAQSYKGGVRLAVVCGNRAYQAIAEAYADSEAAGRMLSVPPAKLTGAVENLLAAQNAEKQRLAALQTALANALAAASADGLPCVHTVEGADGDGLRRIANAVAEKTGARCLVVSPNVQGLSYALCAANGEDMRPLCKELNQKFNGRGGGKAGCCQGSLTGGCTVEELKEWMADR